MSITLQDAVSVSRKVWFEDEDEAHPNDDLVTQALMSELNDTAKSTRRGRALGTKGRNLWDPDLEDSKIAEGLNNLNDFNEIQDSHDKRANELGMIDFADTYSGERVNNKKAEVLSRQTEIVIGYGTPILNTFFDRQRMDAGVAMDGLTEIVNKVEAAQQMGYYPIDLDRGEIKEFTPASSQASDRINPKMSAYGVQAQYENFLHRTLPNNSIGQTLAMFTLGWAQASQEARERDASYFLSEYLSPTTIMSGIEGANTPLGQPSGLSIQGYHNGTLDVDRDVPRITDYMVNDLEMNINNLKALIPQDAWALMNMRKGYRRFIGRDGNILYESPNVERGPDGALQNAQGYFGNDADRYGVKNSSVGFSGPAAAANYLTRSGEQEAAQASSQMPAGPYAFLPRRIPNLMNKFSLPNSAFGPMEAVLSPFMNSKSRYYAEGHELGTDENTGEQRSVPTADILLFDGSRPMHLIESVPPTSWTATNDQYRKSVVVMVEAYAMANRARGEQACRLEGLVIDDAYEPELRLDARDLKVTDHPLGHQNGGDGLRDA